MFTTEQFLKETKKIQILYENLLNRTFIFSYKVKNKDYKMQVLFLKENFKHLTGLEIYIRPKNGKKQTKLNSKEFYEYIKDLEKFDNGVYRLKTKSYSEQKIKVLKELSIILNPEKILAVHTRYKTSDKGLRSKKLVLYLGLIYSDNHYFAPQTALDLKDPNEKDPKGVPIHSIYEFKDNTTNLIATKK